MVGNIRGEAIRYKIRAGILGGYIFLFPGLHLIWWATEVITKVPEGRK